MEGSTVVTDPVSALEDLEITSAVETGRVPAEPTISHGSGGGDGSAASCAWSLTEEQQVRNMKENWKRFLIWINESEYLQFSMTLIDIRIDSNPWFAEAVGKLRVDPCLDSYVELEIGKSLSLHLVSGFKMTSLDAAILMGDLKMVQKILETSPIPDKLIHGSIVDQEKVTNLFLQAIRPEKTGILYTPLHLAVAGGDIHIIDALLEKGANVNDENWLSQSPLDYACKIGSVDMLLRLLEKDEEKKDLVHVAVRHEDVDFIKKLPSPNVNAVDCEKRTALHYLAAYPHQNFGSLTSIVQYLVQDKKLDIKALDDLGLAAFYVAIMCCNTKFVIALLDSFKEQIRLNEVCITKLGPPIQIAFEGREKYKDIEAALMECGPVKSFMETLYRDRQVYVDAANAILVGATLIASVTFASWLQPLLNYTSYSGNGYSSSSSSDLNYVDVEHNNPLRAFWIFNALSFYFAIATVVCGARSVLPRSHLFIKETVEKLRTNLLVTSVLLVCSVLFVIIAFAIAGTIVLMPLLKYQWYMIVLTFIGGMVCIISLVFLVKSMVENSSNIHNTRKDIDRFKDLEGKDYLRSNKPFHLMKLKRDLERSLQVLDHSLQVNIASLDLILDLR